MKIKPLSPILFLFILPCVLISCFSSNDNYESSTDDTIIFFQIDSTGLGNKYPVFTIDQIKNQIFNIDSLQYKADTALVKTLITDFRVGSGYNSEYFITGDSAFNWSTDTIDLSNTMKYVGGEPLKIKVYAPDGLHQREYEVEVRYHQVDPDTMIWRKKSDSFSGGTATGKIKAVTINDEIFIYESYSKVYTTAITDGQSYTKNTITGLDTDSKISNLIPYDNGAEYRLFMTTESGKVFSSNNGINWTESSLSGDIVALLGTFPEYMVGIKEINGVNTFVISNKNATAWNETDVVVPTNFPVDEISSAVYKSVTGIWKLLLVGETSDLTQTTVWTTDDGKSWDVLDEKSGNYRLPYLEQPTLTYYDKQFYAFGDGFKTFYSSENNGLNWNEKELKVVFPTGFKGREGLYTSVVDKDNYLWIFWSAGSNPDEVWKGRINRLGFAIQ